MTRFVAVIGDGRPHAERDALAEQAGAAIAAAGFGVVCGGLGGVMAAACRGAHTVDRGGRPPTVGILPGTDKAEANPWVDVVIPSGMGYARNLLIVLTADAVVAVGGQAGTLSEIAHAWQLGKPVCALSATPGWAARLAGETLDDRRTDCVAEAADAEELAAWLEATLGG